MVNNILTRCFIRYHGPKARADFKRSARWIGASVKELSIKPVMCLVREGHTQLHTRAPLNKMPGFVLKNGLAAEGWETRRVKTMTDTRTLPDPPHRE